MSQKNQPTICIVMEGGVVHNVICDQADLQVRVFTVEYTGGDESENDQNVLDMPQLHKGQLDHHDTAWVNQWTPEHCPVLFEHWHPVLQQLNES
jgi:hypothetical protein